MESGWFQGVSRGSTVQHDVDCGPQNEYRRENGGSVLSLRAPFTVNGAGTLIYANVNDLLGFQIGDVNTGKVIQTVQVQGYGWSRDRLTGHGCPSHGIALSP